MPHNLGEYGLSYKPLADETLYSFGEGRNLLKTLPVELRDKLNKVEDKSKGGDYSRQDSAVITSLLSAGLTAEDTYSTFLASARGRHACERKEGHVDDYIRRTIAKAISFLSISSNENGHANGDRQVKVNFAGETQILEGEGIRSTKASEVEVEYARWLWQGYIPAGKITILGGDPGMGKSTIALDLLSRISRGKKLPTGERTVTGNSIIASAEDAANDTIIPRLIAADADIQRIHIIRDVEIDGSTYYLSFPRDVQRMEEHIVKTRARILMIDPLNAFLERGVDSHKDSDVRSILMPFEAIAEKTKCAVLIVAHRNKKEDASTLYRIGGSIGFTGAARSVLQVDTTPKNQRVLFSSKANLSTRPKSLMYETKSWEGTRQAEEWKGEEKVSSSRIKWRGFVDFDPQKRAPASNYEQTEADTIEWLRDMLKDSELPLDEIRKEARSSGMSAGQPLMSAKTALRIKPEKKRDGKWYWGLPKE